MALALVGVCGFFIGRNSKSTVVIDEDVYERAASKQTARASAVEKKPQAEERKARSAKEISKMTRQSDRFRALADYYADLSADQLEDEAKKLNDLPMPLRMMAASLLFTQWAESDPYSALAFSQNSGYMGEMARPMILQGWASSDPVSAANYYSAHPSEFAMMDKGGKKGINAAEILALEWAKQDPDSALAWVNTITGAEKNEAIETLVETVADSDLEKAKKIAQTLSGKELEQANRDIAQAMAKKNGWADTAAFIAQLPAAEQDKAYQKAIEALSEVNAADALAQLAKVPASKSKTDATSNVLVELSHSSPKQAFDIAMSDAEVSQKGKDMTKIAGNYVAEDENAAYQTFNQMAAGESRDAAVQAYANQYKSNNHQAAFEFANSVTDEKDRAKALATVYQKWNAADSSAAKAALNANPLLSDAVKQNILNGGKGGKKNFSLPQE